jgi:hypothetical protein
LPPLLNISGSVTVVDGESESKEEETLRKKNLGSINVEK